MTISALPTPPSRADSPDTFASQADALLGALPAFVTEANALQSDVNAKQVTASTAATTAITQAGIATTKAGEAFADAADADAARIAAESARDLAAGYRDSAAFSSGQAAASALTASNAAGTCASLVAGIADGPVTSVNGKTGIVALTPADIGAEPAQAAATQAEMEAGTEAALRAMSPLRIKQAIDVLAGSKLIRSARTSDTILGTADKATLIDITSGTFTQTFAACSTLGDGWFCYIRNGGTGDITLDPNASETIDGLTSFAMYPGEVRLVQCDGSALRTVVLNAFYKVFTTSGTFTKPPGYASFEGLLWGGGGGGIKDPTNAIGGGGGACAPIKLTSSELPSSVIVTIAASASGSTTTTGNAGNNSTFHVVTAYGAQAIAGANSGGTGGAAFVPALSVTVNSVIGGASPTLPQQAYFGGAGGGTISGRAPTVFGGGGGGGINDTAVQPIRGETVFGGAGGGAGDAAMGGNGTAPGGGGGSTRTGTKGGDGARGELRIWGII